MMENELIYRCQLVKMNPDILIGLGKVEGITTVGTPIPNDARVVHRYIDERGDIVLTVESDAFPVVREGQWLLTIPGPAFRAPTYHGAGRPPLRRFRPLPAIRTVGHARFLSEIPRGGPSGETRPGPRRRK